MRARAHLARRSCQRASSSLTRRIVVLNLAGLVALLVGFLYLNQFRAGPDRGARAEPADAGRDHRRRHRRLGHGRDRHHHASIPTSCCSCRPARRAALERRGPSPLEFSINPERVAPLLRRLVTPTRTRARIYDREGSLLLDSRSLYSRGDILRFDLPPVAEAEPEPDRAGLERAPRPVPAQAAARPRGDRPAERQALPEVQQALARRARQRRARSTRAARPSSRWPCRSSASAPCSGALLLSTQGGDIDAIIASERFALLQVFLVAALVMIVLSLLLAGTIAGPVRRLADAAERVRRGHQVARRRSRISPRAPTRSAISPARCAT